jgi:hypothetical protein
MTSRTRKRSRNSLGEKKEKRIEEIENENKQENKITCQ